MPLIQILPPFNIPVHSPQHLYSLFFQVDNELVNLPMYLNSSQVSVYRSGWYSVVITSFGLNVSFDWNSAMFVTLPSTNRALSVACVATKIPVPR